MVKHVREFEIEALVIERLGMEVTLQHQWRVRHQIDPHRVTHSDSPQRFHLLSDSGSDAKRLRLGEQKVSLLQISEKLRENQDFSVPISGNPYFSEFGVEGLVELALDVGIVGGVARADLDAAGEFGGGPLMGCLDSEKKEDSQGEGEREEQGFEEKVG